MSQYVCPRCGHHIPNDIVPGAYPGALSRYDNETEVCSDCGTEEALIQWSARVQGKDADEAVDPVDGRVPWVVKP